jgi:hypothetical protein
MNIKPAVMNTSLAASAEQVSDCAGRLEALLTDGTAHDA